MRTAVVTPAGSGVLAVAGRTRGDSLAAALIAGSVVTYFGLRGGGYDPIVSSQVGIAVWWILLLLVLSLRPARLRLRGSAWVAIGLLTAYAAWTALSLTWTQSSESSMSDVSQLLLYVGVALLVLLVQGRRATRHVLHGLALAIVVIAIVALLSRLRFQWFGIPAIAVALPSSARKLSYPINYWNALAALMAIGIPLLLHAATGARTLLVRAVAGGAIPLLALCAFLTVSRGGIIATAIGVLVFLALAPERGAKLAVVVAAGGGSALLIAAAQQRPAIRDGLRSAVAAHQGDQLLAIALVVVAGVGLLVTAIALVDRHVDPPRVLVVTRRQATVASAAALLAALAVFSAAGGIGFLHREWTQFKSAGGPASLNEADALGRLANVSGNGRYQYWQSAARAASAKPFTGTGAGTFQFWWAQHGTLSGGFVLDAHSLYLQALGELGYPGLALIAGFVGWILLCGVAGVIRGRDPARRLALAAATAGAFAFAFSAAFEWIWFIPVLPVTLIVMAGVILAPDGTGPGTRDKGAARVASRTRGLLRGAVAGGLARAAIALGSLAAIVVIALPMAATAAVRQSQTFVRSGNLTQAFDDAVEATRLEPYAATPWLQAALVLEQAGRLHAALADAERAVNHEPTASNNWLVLSRLEARNGHAHAALRDYRRARDLNPRSPVFSAP